MHSYIQLGWNQLLNVGVDQWFQICIMYTCQWVYVLFKGLFASSFPSMPQWLGIQQKRTCVPLLLNNQSRFMIWHKRFLGVFTRNCLQTRHWARVDYFIVMNWTHVMVIVQCQSDGCSLSSKYGAIVWQSFGQLAAGCLTILEMAVDDRRCPHSLIHFGAICVNFIMWSLCFVILIEFSLGFSGDHTFAHSFNEVVSLGVVIVRSWWKAGCPQGADQLGIDPCGGHGCLETNGRGRRSGHASSPIWAGGMQISSGSVKFMQGMICWVVGVSQLIHVLQI